VRDALGDVLGDLGGYDAANACRMTESAIDQTGGSPLESPTLEVDYACTGTFTAPAPISAPGPPVGKGDWLLVAAITGEPLDPANNIAVQPGLGLDRTSVPNRAAGDHGEGLDQVPIDLVAFAGQPGWNRAQVYDPDGFAPLDQEIYAFFQHGSPVQAFVLPVELVDPETVVYFQSFGRQTAPGAIATGTDPAVSYRVDIGPLGGCARMPGPCVLPPPLGRFEVLGELNGVEVSGVERGAGMFFFHSDNTELVVKVLNACAFNDRFWVFAAGLTQQSYTFTINDVGSRPPKTFTFTGSPAQPITDTSAFATCP
jgi:hypothetical protein